MTRSKKKESIPPELRDELIRIALSTDCIAKYNIDGWRESAICAARWLLRAAALSDEMPRTFAQAFKTVAEIADKLRKNPVLKTESDEIIEVLEKHRFVKLKDIS